MKINWLHIVNTLAGGLAIVGGLSPALFGPYAAQAALAIGGATITANVLHAVIQASPSATVPPAVKLILVGFLVLGFGTGVVACKTLPPPTQQAGITVAVDIATGESIQNGGNSDTWKIRAVKFKAIAISIKQVNDAGTATLATLAADLEPQLATLPPADQLAAHALVAALQPYLDDKVQANPDLANVRATLDVILQAVIDSCSVYGA